MNGPQPAKLSPFEPKFTVQSVEFGDYSWLAGRVYDFNDGAQLHVLQVKVRDGGMPWVTSEHVYPHALPRRFSEDIKTFMDRYGHLFQNQ